MGGFEVSIFNCQICSTVPNYTIIFTIICNEIFLKRSLFLIICDSKNIRWNRTKGREAKYNNGLFDQPDFLAQVHTYKLRAFPGKKSIVDQ